MEMTRATLWLTGLYRPLNYLLCPLTLQVGYDALGFYAEIWFRVEE